MKDYREPVSIGYFESFVQTRLTKIKNVLIKKSYEYVRGDDKLYNFNRGSATLDQSREKYLMSLAMKHILSAIDMVEDIDKGISHSNDYIDEKIGDIINYMILLEVSLKQRNDERMSAVQEEI
jgi:hypothetical protein